MFYLLVNHINISSQISRNEGSFANFHRIFSSFRSFSENLNRYKINKIIVKYNQKF